ncbi:SKI family transcriptional corepressor 1 [Eublepharis macularius]|uniref:SKI family transcriptional corepressor 1 n=1 Tax=Eublepharis macularius TaxID=481883 RepID=A0AA97KN38_EUBMA|nr:SKI family transcriptional corepressor 1 [Eublepharis macularius]
MESLAAASQLGSGRESGSSSSSSPHSKQELQPYSGSSPLKPNQVGETSLYGVPIVSLVIDGQERLCLAQISNTLLKNYSYNEIHNRRVALGITCVQCTPVQLEILRRAGAMPISSRRCGMITKREAERLCKSFLGEHKPPKLPENFAFDVVHECAWGSRGSFIPARYNSSRAKCIKCSYCSMYFSPNKFIFHSHRTPEAKYTQPDAANFNSWRRHLKLSDKTATDDLSHAWEDVKAMFNGGTRKRTFSLHGAGHGAASPGSKSALHPPPPPAAELAPAHKSLRCAAAEEQPGERGALGLPAGAHGPAAAAVRSYPVIPVPSKGFGMLQKLPPPLFPPPYGFPAAAFGLCPKKQDEALGGAGGGEPGKGGALPPGMFWGPPHPHPPQPQQQQQPGASAKDSGVYPSFPMFWPASGSLPVPPYPAQSQAKAAATAVVVAAAAAAAAAAVEPLGLRGHGHGHGHVELEGSEPSGSERGSATPQEGSGSGGAEGERCASALSRAAAVGEEERSGDEALLPPLPLPRKGSYLSAFRPVVKDAESIAKLYGTREAYGGPRGCPGYLSPDFLSEGSSSYRSLSPGNDTLEEPEVDVESNRFPDDDDEEEEEAPGEDAEEGSLPPPPSQPPLLLPGPEESLAAPGSVLPAVEKAAAEKPPEPEGSPARSSSTAGYEVYPPEREERPQALKGSAALALQATTTYLCTPERNDPDKEDNHSAAEDLEGKKSYQDQRNAAQPSPAHAERGEEVVSIDVSGTQLVEKDIGNLARDELQKLLLEQMELRKKLERDFQSLKDNFQDQMKRELAYREEMVQQLQIVRDTLCNELDQERKARYAIQQKLKEAHDALHHFSCKMLTPRHCTGNCSFKPPLLPQ